MANFDTIYPFSRLRRGKFRGLEFYILKDGDTKGGRKTVVHEFVNTDRRFVEDLGKLKDIYTLELYVDTNNGNNERDQFIKALNKKGIGILIHPFLGKKNVTVTGWSFVNNYGNTQFNVTFNESDSSIIPQNEIGKKSLLESLKEEIKDLQETRIGEVFNAVGKGYKVFSKSVTKVNDFSEELLDVSNEILNVTSELSTLTNTLNDTLDNVATIIKTPATLASRISNIFTQFELIGSRAVDQFDATKQLFGFGSDDTDTKTTTSVQRQIKINNDALNISIRANALALAYENAANIDYANENDLEERKRLLEEEYESLIYIADRDTSELLKEIRSNGEIVFQNLEKTVPKVYTVYLTSYNNIHQIVHNYYGNFNNAQEFEEKVQEIWNLNSFTNLSKIRGTVKLLTQNG